MLFHITEQKRFFQHFFWHFFFLTKNLRFSIPPPPLQIMKIAHKSRKCFFIVLSVQKLHILSPRHASQLSLHGQLFKKYPQ